jgi:hypothetical protein
MGIFKKLFPKKTGTGTSTRRGLFRPDQQRKLARKADEKAKMKGLKEKIDGPVFLASLTLLDDLVFNRLPDETKAKLYPMIDFIIDKLPD